MTDILAELRALEADTKATWQRAERLLNKVEQAQTITEAKQGQPRSIWTGNVTPLRDYTDNSGDVA